MFNASAHFFMHKDFHKFYTKENYLDSCKNDKISTSRQFTTLDNQILKLKNRDLSFNKINEDDAKSILEKIHYYKIVNGYKEFFVKTDPAFPNEDFYCNTDFQEILELYLFDEELRFLLLEALLKFECEFKSILAYVFMEKHTPYGYTNLLSFNNKRIKNNKPLEKLIQEDLIEPIFNHSKQGKDFIEHFVQKREAIPFYALVGTLSFGTINIFYKYMINNEKMEIAKHFNHSNLKEFGSIINRLGTIRNICAHSNRLFAYKFKYRYT